MTSIDCDKVLKTHSVIADVVIRPDLCNIRCSYCGLTIEECPTLLYRRDQVGRYHSSSKEAIFEHPQEIIHRTREYIEMMRGVYQTPVLKLSGGEITAIPGLINLAFEYAEKVPVVQILTNGTGLDAEMISRCAEKNNIHIQLSLDGNTIESNKYRGIGSKTLDRILGSIKAICQLNIPLEFNTVVTNANVNSFLDFAEWLQSVSNNDTVKVFPRPVRGKSKSKFLPSDNEYQKFFEDLSKSTCDTLPPSSYVESFYNFVMRRKPEPCYTPFFVVGLEDRGMIPKCTCSGSLGSLIESSENSKFGDLERWPIESSRPGACRDCFNQYELFNLYVDGRISADEIYSLPLFKNYLVRKTLKNIKRSLSLLKSERKDNITTLHPGANR